MKLVWIPPARNGEYNSLKYKFHFIKYNLIANIILFRFLCIYVLKSLDCHKYIQWGKKVFSQPPIVQVLPEACNFHHRYTSTMRDKIRKKNPENHIVGFLKNLFANYGGK